MLLSYSKILLIIPWVNKSLQPSTWEKPTRGVNLEEETHKKISTPPCSGTWTQVHISPQSLVWIPTKGSNQPSDFIK